MKSLVQYINEWAKEPKKGDFKVGEEVTIDAFFYEEFKLTGKVVFYHEKDENYRMHMLILEFPEGLQDFYFNRNDGWKPLTIENKTIGREWGDNDVANVSGLSWVPDKFKKAKTCWKKLYKRVFGDD